MTGLTEAGLLRVWDEGQARSPAGRALLLATAAAGERADPDAVAELPLGRRNELLLDLQELCFGPALPCVVMCPGCEESLDVSVTVDELRFGNEGPLAETVRIGGIELELRALTSADLLSVDPSAPEARQALLSRCVSTLEPLPEQAFDEIAARLRDLDPQADLELPLECPECGHAWRAWIDLAEHLWAEIDAYGRRLVHEVCALATAFGWTEADVLAVSPARRRLYLEASVT
jgi:hypothetical protein